MPARALIAATLCVGFGLGVLCVELMMPSVTRSYVLPQLTVAAPIVLTVVVDREVTPVPTATRTISAAGLTATARPSPTPRPTQIPTSTPWTNNQSNGRSETK